VALRFEPRALVFWWTPVPGCDPVPPNRGGIGFATASCAAAAVAWASDAGVERIRAAGWIDDAAVVVLDGADAQSPALSAGGRIRRRRRLHAALGRHAFGDGRYALSGDRRL